MRRVSFLLRGVGARRSLSSVKAVFSASIFWRRWVFLLNAIFEKYLDGSRQFGIEQFVVGRVGEVVREVVLLQHSRGRGAAGVEPPAGRYPRESPPREFPPEDVYQRVVRVQSAVEFLAGNFFGLDVVAARTDRLAVRLGGAVGPLGDEFTFGDEFRVAVLEVG